MATEEEQKVEGRIIYIGHIDQKEAKAVIVKLLELDMADSTAPIKVIINSYGGEVDSMFAIYDAMRTCVAPLITIGLGKAMSAAVLLLSAGEKGERRISSHTRIMAHELSMFAWGKLYEVENEAKEGRRLQRLMEKSLARESGKTVKKIQKIMASHIDTFMEAELAVEYGFADKVL